MHSEQIEATTIHQIATPMFVVCNDIVTEINNAARNLQICEGMSVHSILTNNSEYAQFRNGKLFLAINISGAKYNASVTAEEDRRIFAIDTSNAAPAICINTDFAKTLREPLSSAVTHIDLMYNAAVAAKEQNTKSILATRQNLFRMLRSVQNIIDSDPRSSWAASSQLEYRDIISHLNNCVSRLQQRTSLADLFVINTLEEKIICRFDPEGLERAILNLIANAIKHSTGTKPATISLRHKNDTLYITVENHTNAANDNLRRSLAAIPSSNPFINPYDAEIGCGIKVIRNVALEHGGTLQMQLHQTEDNEICEARFTMTVSTTSDSIRTLYSPTHLIIDRSGGYDRILIDMSDLLTPDDYK